MLYFSYIDKLTNWVIRNIWLQIFQHLNLKISFISVLKDKQKSRFFTLLLQMENVAKPQPPRPPTHLHLESMLSWIKSSERYFLCTAKAVGCCSNTPDWRWHWFSFHLGFCQAFSHRFFTWGGRRGAIKCASLCTTSGTLQHSLPMVYRCVMTTFSRLFVYANSQRHEWWFHNRSSSRDSWRWGVLLFVHHTVPASCLQHERKQESMRGDQNNLSGRGSGYGGVLEEKSWHRP